MYLSKITAVLAVGLFIPTGAFAASLCPTFGGDPLSATQTNTHASDYTDFTGCNEVITIGATGTVSITVENSHPYDGQDDQLVGVIDDYTGGSVSSIQLNGGSNDIFGFDGDGISTFTHDATDSTGYGGPDTTFSGINVAKTQGTVTFTTPLTLDGTAYFSLEDAPSSGTAGFTGTLSPTPEPSSLMLLGTGVLGLAGSLRRRIANAAR
jgi:hypothetical protein